jgi:hypothetical protein
MILAGQDVPADWIPFVTQLGFGEIAIRDNGSFYRRSEKFLPRNTLSRLVPLRRLRHLALAGMRVKNLDPLRNCTGLQRLWLNNTQVSVAEVRRFRAARKRARLGEVRIEGVR